MTQAIDYGLFDSEDWDDEFDSEYDDRPIVYHGLRHGDDCGCSDCETERYTRRYEELMEDERFQLIEPPTTNIEELRVEIAEQFERHIQNAVSRRRFGGAWGRTASYRNFGRKPRYTNHH